MAANYDCYKDTAINVLEQIPRRPSDFVISLEERPVVGEMLLHKKELYVITAVVHENTARSPFLFVSRR